MRSKWHRREFNALGVTQYPAGSHLPKFGPPPQKIYVTTPGFDNIGEILKSMNVDFEPFRGAYDCTILFINCGTSDLIDPAALADFVSAGGCVYASDHADHYIAAAFPGVFDFGGYGGQSGKVAVDVLDPELKDILGAKITVEFDMGAWALLKGCRGEVLLRGAKGGAHAGQPIMAYAGHGEGSVFYTCFHNKAQTSKHEKQLLQLLVVKQFSTTSRQTVEQAGRALGLSLDTIRKDLRR